MALLFLAAAATAAASVAVLGPAAAATQLPPPGPVALAQPAPAQLIADGTPVRLMVLHEVTSRTAHAGDRIELRVDEPVFIDGKPAIAVGATAWGEVVFVKGNGAAGKGGQLTARVLYVEVAGTHVPLTGTIAQKGDGNSGGVLLAVAAWGPFGLLNAGDSARLKGGQTFTAYVHETR
jgi:hypothetical protein